jgi:hypothetical protein
MEAEGQCHLQMISSKSTDRSVIWFEGHVQIFGGRETSIEGEVQFDVVF